MAIVPFVFGDSELPFSVYSGETDVSGEFTVVYEPPYSSPRIVIPLMVTETSRAIKVISNTATGFTIKVEDRASVTVLGINVLNSTTFGVSGQSVTVVALNS